MLQFVKILDPDVFYHFRHAALYIEHGVFFSDFPWLPYSAIGKYGADIWYGFHLFLIPFAWAGNEILGIKIFAVFSVFVFLGLLYWVFRREGIRWPFFWPFAVFFASFFGFIHFTLARPHVFSAGLSIVLFSFLLANNLWMIFVVSFLLVFLHLSLFWLPLLVFIVLALVRYFTEKIVIWREGMALLVGVILGWLLRPNPFGAAKLAYIQIVELFLEKQRGTPLNFGYELYPLSWQNFSVYWPFLVLWALAVLIFISLRQSKSRIRVALWGSLGLSTLFFAMTMFVAERSLDLWIIFGTMFIALVWSESKAGFFKYAAILMCVSAAIYTLYSYKNIFPALNFDEQRFAAPSEWLSKNSQPGDIVFNASWDYFPDLFFWNTKNYYISGMDPIFQYAYDQKLYWEAYYLETGKTAEFTCQAVSCDEKTIEDTYGILKNNFKARYVFLEKSEKYAPLYHYLSNEGGFAVGYEDQSSVVFTIK